MPTDGTLHAAAPLVAALLAWFDASARDLPWRSRPSLYGTWISEMMLQQTTVAAVVPYWQRFLARFPDVGALAAADEAEVLALWSGLGYYRRARLLHQASRMIVARHGGSLPTDRAGWRELPGVGEYAAGAIASIGLGERAAALDANARRVLTRWAVGDPAALPAWTPARLRSLGEALVPADRPGAWNEAVMELGATVCRARDPGCGACPVAAWCRAGLAGTAHLVPAPVVRAAAQPVAVSMAVAQCGGRVLLLPPERPPLPGPDSWPAPVRADLGGLHRGLWGLPTTAWYAPPGDPAAWTAQALAAWSAWAGPDLAAPPRRIGRAVHAITRYKLVVEIVALEFRPGASAASAGGPDAEWTPWPSTRPVSKLVRKVVAGLSHPSG